MTEIDVNTTTVTLNNLLEGMTYLIFVSAFTSKGVGPNTTFSISCKSSACYVIFETLRLLSGLPQHLKITGQLEKRLRISHLLKYMKRHGDFSE